MQSTCSAEGCDLPVRCKGVCNRHYQQQWRDAHREECRASIARSKLKNADRVASYNERYRAENREQIRERWRGHYAANREQRLEQGRRYRAEFPERRRAAVAAWQKANPERHAATTAAWARANRARRCLIESTRRARKRDSGAFAVSVRDIVRMLNRFDHRCAYCGTDITNSYHLDHVVPLARGGQHAIGNLVPSCPSCNARKGTRTVMEWRQRSLHLAA